ncbi:hypothetical protein [Salimicrobium jeotgali]|uniref:hypothetical protein n=1 Tax=Salimicrobium jeotgali TaxID=1230341 RepID=UPI0015E0DF76|nr:hypothetical protein [Salimicrobium jeotgali]
MKVKVKDIPVRYDDKRYTAGDTLDIKQDYFDDNLFEEVNDGKARAKSKKEDE